MTGLEISGYVKRLRELKAGRKKRVNFLVLNGNKKPLITC